MGFKEYYTKRKLHEDEIATQAMIKAPASSEVIRTNKQPQVNNDGSIKHKEQDNDKLLALDGHIQRIQLVIQSMKDSKAKSLCQEFIEKWRELKQGDQNKLTDTSINKPVDPRRIAYQKENQPLPEIEKKAGPGTFGVDA